jgi:hypothetical protein
MLRRRHIDYDLEQLAVVHHSASLREVATAITSAAEMESSLKGFLPGRQLVQELRGEPGLLLRNGAARSRLLGLAAACPAMAGRPRCPEAGSRCSTKVPRYQRTATTTASVPPGLPQHHPGSAWSAHHLATAAPYCCPNRLTREPGGPGQPGQLRSRLVWPAWLPLATWACTQQRAVRRRIIRAGAGGLVSADAATQVMFARRALVM